MDLNALLSREFPSVNHSYGIKDTILYALGVGAGADPVNPRDLPFVYEEGLRIVPSQAAVLGRPGFWLSDPGIKVNWLKLLHGEESIEFTRPLKPVGEIRSEFRVIGVDDKGPEKGATVYFEKQILDAKDNDVICVARSTYFLRADGGCGSWGVPAPQPQALPDRAPDESFDLPTIPRQALIYRLNGDLNPIHIAPDAAAKAGFDKPILHGLCTFGVACFGIVQHLCGGDPDRLKEIFVRFSRPVYPGETIRLELYHEGTTTRFRARVLERDIVVLDRASAVVTA